MSKVKHLSAATAVLALGSLGLAGCASAGSPSTSKTVSLTIEDYYQASPISFQQKAYIACAAQEKVNITVNHVAETGLISKVLQQASSKTMPDVLMLDNPQVKQIAATGALSPLANFGLSGSNEAKGAVAASTYKGKLYGLQPVANSLALFYNKSLFSAAGLTAPTTWAELAADAKTLTTPAHYGIAFSVDSAADAAWQFISFMWSNGGNEKELNSPQNIQALQFVTNLVNAGSASKSVLSWSGGDVNSQFMAGKAAMMINGPWNIPSLQQQKGLNWDYVEIPTRLASQVSQSPLGGEAWTVPNTGNQTKMQAAAKMVACINGPESQRSISAGAYVVPTNPTVAKAFAKGHSSLAGFVKIIGNGRSRTGLLDTGWPLAQTKIYDAEQLALTGKASPADALKQAAAEQ